MRRENSNLVDVILCFAGLSFLFSFAAVLCGADAKSCFVFFLYQLCGVFIPGLAVLLLLNRKYTSDFDFLSFICLSYALGYSLQIFLYFLTVASGFRSEIPLILTICMCILATLVCGKYFRSKYSLQLKATAILWIVLYSIFLLLVYFAYSGNYKLPLNPGESVSFHADALYWIENAAALTKSFPPAELRMSGTILYYHYFASAYLAFANMVTGIDVFSLGYAFYPLGKSLIFFGGLYELSKVFKNDRIKQFLFLFILLFTTGLERYSIVNYVAHILTLPFGFDIGFGFGAWFLSFLIRQRDKDRFDVQLCVLSVISFLMCSGHKAPIALIYLLIAGITCLYWLFNKKIKNAFAYGIPIILSFAFVMIVCIGFLRNQDNGLSAGSFSHVATLRASPLFQDYEQIAIEHKPGLIGTLPVVARYVKLMFLLVLSINPLILFFSINGIYTVIKNKKVDIIDLSLLASGVFGSVMGLFNAQEGVSQMYYTLSAFVPLLLFGLRHFNLSKQWIYNPRSIVALLLVIVQCFWFFHDSSVAENTIAGFKNLTALKAKITEVNSPYSMQHYDYDALTWIRDKTEKDSLILSDRSVFCDLDNYMFYGTFSERQMYLEGDRYFYQTFVNERERRRNIITSLFRNNSDAFLSAATDGVDYIVQTKWITPDFEGNGCTPVYETDTIKIWKIDR